MTEKANQPDLEETNRINSQLSAPVTEDNRSVPVDGTVVGPFLGQTTPYKEEPRETTNPKPSIIREQRPIGSAEDLAEYRDLAHQNGDNIIMPEYNLAPELANKLKNVHNNSTIEYLNGNPAAQLSVYFHELAHYDREHKGISNMPNGNAETNLTLNYVDEKSAYVAENLALVNIYNHCKKEGAEYFVYKDIKIKTDELLDIYPNLRETIEKNGSDLTDKKTVIALSKNAAEQWENNNLQGYKEGEFAAFSIETNRSIVEQIQAVKDGEKAMDAQLKDINIGYGMRIDLPDECKSFIYPDKKKLQEYICETEDGRHPSNDGLLAIDAYLEKRGLKTNEAKDEYIREQYKKIVDRAPDADTTLKDLMLNAELNPNNDKRIYYTDALMEKMENGSKVVCNVNSNDRTFYPVTNEKAQDNQLAQQLKSQTGKYPPDAPTQEMDDARTLATAQVSNACTMNDYKKQKTAEQPAPQVEQQQEQQPKQQDASVLLVAQQKNSR